MPTAHRTSELAEDEVAYGKDGPPQGRPGRSSWIQGVNFQPELIFNFE
jgi:hypothetical protein